MFDSSTLLERHVIHHTKKKICNYSATNKDLEFAFSAKDSPSHIVYELEMSQF